MKQSLSFFGVAISIILLSCGSNQNEATKQAAQIQNAVKENTPGSIPTTASGWTLKAKINGKDWVAGSMMPPAAAGRVIGYYKDEYIGLPYDDKNNFLRTKERKLGEGGDGVDIKFDSYDGLWSATKGTMELTQVGDTWVEGIFSFTAKKIGGDETIAVTDGFFRISVQENK